MAKKSNKAFSVLVWDARFCPRRKSVPKEIMTWSIRPLVQNTQRRSFARRDQGIHLWSHPPAKGALEETLL